MGILSVLSFLSPKSIDKAVDAGKNITDGMIAGIDKVWYTNEEKAEAKQKASETILKYWEAIAKENTEQSKARRFLASLTFVVFFLFLVVSAGVYKWDIEYSKFLLDLAGKISWLVSAIAVIYFGPHQLQKLGIMKGKND